MNTTTDQAMTPKAMTFLHQQLDQVEEALADRQAQARLARVTLEVYGETVPIQGLERVVTPAPVDDTALLTEAPADRKAWLAWIKAPYRRPANKKVFEALNQGFQQLEDEGNKIFGRALIGAGLILALSIPSMALPLPYDVLIPLFLGLCSLAVGIFYNGIIRAKFGGNGAPGNIKMAQYRAHPLTAGDVAWWGADPSVAARAVALCRSDVPLLAGDVENLQRFVQAGHRPIQAVNEALLGVLEKHAMTSPRTGA